MVWEPWRSVQNFGPIDPEDVDISHRSSANCNLLVAVELGTTCDGDLKKPSVGLQSSIIRVCVPIRILPYYLAGLRGLPIDPRVGGLGWVGLGWVAVLG